MTTQGHFDMRRGPEAVVRAIQTWGDGWARAVQQFTLRADGGAPTPQSRMQPQDLIDQVFDFGEQLLSVQREFAHRMIQAASTSGGKPSVTGALERTDSGLPERARPDDQVTEPRGRGPLGENVRGPETDEAMTRSEAEVQVEPRHEETGRARLHKHQGDGH
jgi:hypothetical protein